MRRRRENRGRGRIVLSRVGRIDEDEIEGRVGRFVAGGNLFQAAERIEKENLRAVLYFEGIKIAAD